jgi:hypothetical protein
MNNENTEAWKDSKSLELRRRIGALANKLVLLAQDVRKFGPHKVRKGFKFEYMERNGMIRHWHKMAKVSMVATRKKIQKLKDEMAKL